MGKTIKIHPVFTERMRLAFLQPHKDFNLTVGITNMLWMAEHYDPANNDHPPVIIPAEPNDDMVTAFCNHLSKKSDDIEGAFFACIGATRQ